MAESGDIPPSGLAPITGRKSAVWKHFRCHPVDATKVVCFHCYPSNGRVRTAHSYSITSSTRNLYDHVKKKHPEQLEDAGSPRKRPRQSTLDGIAPRLSNDRKAHCDQTLMKWMVFAGRPLSYVRDPHFKAIGEQFGWTLPSEETLKSLITKEFETIRSKVPITSTSSLRALNHSCKRMLPLM